MSPSSIPHDLAGPGPRLTDAWDFAPADAQIRTRLVFGNGSSRRLPEFVQECGGSRVLMVTDPGLARAGHPARMARLLEEAGLTVGFFDQTRENPDTECVEACLGVARAFRPDLFLGLGGGSSMDTAKGCNFLLTNGGAMRDYWGVGKATRPMLPFIAVPTTAGTGSECQSAALIADAATHMKMACLDPKAAARIALLDPELTLSQPPKVTACTGIDAVAHAVESAVTTKRSAVSSMYSREAFRLLAPSLPKVMKSPEDLAARGRMLLGAAFAGTAIELSMLGAAHSAANPLTAHFNVVHGIAVGLMLPHVVRWNAHEPRVAAAYAELLSGVGWDLGKREPRQAALILSERLQELAANAGLPSNLREAGVDGSRIPEMAAEAAAQWTARFNPRAVSAADFEELYSAALG